jgi:succinate dehydrogenase (ubiquinone) membrane anchor subunit
MSFNKILFADAAGPQFQKIYSKSHYTLAGLVPAGLVSETGSVPAKISDVGLAVAIPVHGHIAMNFGELDLCISEPSIQDDV